MTVLIDRIRRAFPESFFSRLRENMDAEFAGALSLTEQYIAEPEQRGALGQIRHFYAERGFRNAAEEAGLTPRTLETVPPGGKYSTVSQNGVHLVRSNIQKHSGMPRATNFRMEMSAMNSWLDPFQPDLFLNVQEPSEDHLCAILIVTAHDRSGDLSVPAFVGLGIPRADMSDWVHLMSLTTLSGLYNDPETPEEAPLEVEDTAIPRLRRRLTENVG